MKTLLRVALVAGVAAACASDGPDTALRSPEGYDGSLRVRPDPAVFEETLVGCEERLSLRILNTHAEKAVAVAGAAGPNGSVAVSGALPLGVPPGGEASLELRFAPVTAGDWSGVVRLATDEEDAVYPLETTAVGVARPETAEDLEASKPLDLIFVLDVSTTMYEMASLRAAIQGLFDFVASRQLDVRFGLTTFENEVVLHRDGAFLDREAFFAELDAQLVEGRWVPDPEQARQLLNFDFPENSLDALHRSATDFPFRPEARRTFLLMTDDTFREPPYVFSDGTPATFSYAQVADVLDERGIRLISVHASARGRGLSSGYQDRPSLVERTGGTWFELEDVSSGALALDALLADLVVGSRCD